MNDIREDWRREKPKFEGAQYVELNYLKTLPIENLYDLGKNIPNWNSCNMKITKTIKHTICKRYFKSDKHC